MSNNIYDQLDLIGALAHFNHNPLNMFEQADLMRYLCTRFQLTQHDLAKHLHISQSSVGNKIRLLQYTDQERYLILKHHLSERHARTLLRILPPKRIRLIETVVKMHVTVLQSEELIEKYQTNTDDRENLLSHEPISVENYISSIQSGAEKLQRNGNRVSCLTETSDHCIKLSLTVFLN